MFTFEELETVNLFFPPFLLKKLIKLLIGIKLVELFD